MMDAGWINLELQAQQQRATTRSLSERIALAVVGLGGPLALALMGGFMGVFLMAMGADGASGQAVKDVAWTFAAFGGSMLAVGASGVVLAASALLSSRRLLWVGLGAIGLGLLGAAISFGVYFVTVAA